MQMTNFDVVNNSWGWEPYFTPDDPPPADFYAQALPTYENAAEHGRMVDSTALGTVIVKAAGNSGVNANGDELSASRYAIVVAAADDAGVIAGYSNWGANVLVAAPSGNGDFLFGNGILTTDLLGAAGLTDGDYTGTDGLTGFSGTSAATPMVTGVVALMLDANLDLGWRDVQDILAYSAVHTGTEVYRDPAAGDIFGGFFLTEKDIWEFNGADNWNGGGLHVSEDYGFGAVDVYNAVRMAEAWSYFGAAATSANESYRTVSATPALPRSKRHQHRHRHVRPGVRG